MYKEISKFIFCYASIFLIMAGTYTIVTPQQEVSFYISLSAISLFSNAIPYIKGFVDDGANIKVEAFKFILYFLIIYAFLAAIYSLLSSEHKVIVHILISVVAGVLSVSPYIRAFVKKDSSTAPKLT